MQIVEAIANKKGQACILLVAAPNTLTVVSPTGTVTTANEKLFDEEPFEAPLSSFSEIQVKGFHAWKARQPVSLVLSGQKFKLRRTV